MNTMSGWIEPKAETVRYTGCKFCNKTVPAGRRAVSDGHGLPVVKVRALIHYSDNTPGREVICMGSGMAAA